MKYCPVLGVSSIVNPSHEGFRNSTGSSWLFYFEIVPESKRIFKIDNERKATMKRKVMRYAAVFLLCTFSAAASAWAGQLQPPNDAGLKKEVKDLQKKVADLEQKIGTESAPSGKFLQSALSGLQVSGGISAGSFYASNPGKDVSDNEFLLSNFLVQLSSTDNGLPVGFTGAFGETSTPSVLSVPENNTDMDIEYASLTVTPAADIHLEVGLLQPNAGFENTYTYNNVNAILGALASQQPYNAYGARLDYETHGLQFCAGYYKDRRDRNEYGENGYSPGDSWELGVVGAALGNKFSLYHYHLEGQRNLTGMVVERTIKNVDFAVNIDYWVRDTTMNGAFGSRSALGGAFYIVPHFGRFSLPVRLEYIDQGKSRIYIDNADAKHIYAATISPTFRFCDSAYIRAETAYVNADNAFADKDGNSKNNRICLAAEVGYIF